ncbi:hypothetical protein [Azospirillum argentinense]
MLQSEFHSQKIKNLDFGQEPVPRCCFGDEPPEELGLIR